MAGTYITLKSKSKSSKLLLPLLHHPIQNGTPFSFLLSNHPLGIFHLYMRIISYFFNRMVKDLDSNSDRYGFLGASRYIANERATANEVMILAYLCTYEGLHTFAHAEGGVHREAWSYWNTEVMAKGKTEEGRMFSIMYEAYQVPVGKWENIYVNYDPSGLGAMTQKVNVHGREKWVRPLIDTRKGLLRNSKGRMAVSAENDREIYGDDPYANETARLGPKS
ncbi:hypothetical protein N7510_006365 [Penicillium lagena]|uniref:uncharacterized protein n=1 Tax=Penicillium lagena TaxID=94218 RepID=UPI002541A6EA|nr:uncharacterized protein N7510_006365 [Penicillium lagena]KAJ5613171.1 hypothetical protein N7510_006365 [Penicillium lagena]